MPDSLDRPENSPQSTPMEYRVLWMFNSSVMQWFARASEVAGYAGQGDAGPVPPFEERNALFRIAVAVNSDMTGRSYSRQEKHASIAALIPAVVEWSRGLESRQWCVAMLNELRICLK